MYSYRCKSKEKRKYAMKTERKSNRFLSHMNEVVKYLAEKKRDRCVI